MFRSESIEKLTNIPSADTWKEQSQIPGPVNLFFEDNFEAEKPKFEPLSDSKEYLAILERRLAKLQNPKALEQLRQKRDQCMRELLGGEATHQGILTDSQLNLETSVAGLTDKLGAANEIIRFIKPEQPLTVGEVVPIIKHDQLEQQSGTETEKSDSEVEK